MFADKVVVITGGSSGLGKALAERLYDRGANLALIARSMDKLKTVKAELQENYGVQGKIELFSCDIVNENDVETSIKQICETIGEPDILINNAGILREGRFDKQSPDVFRQIMDINFYGAVHCTRALLPIFLKKKKGRIVNIASIAGRLGVYGYAAYCSSKHALVGFTASLRCELKPENIQLQIAFPSEFDSPMVDDVNTYRSEENRAMAQTIPTMPLEKVADEIVRGIEKDRYEIIPGLLNRIATKSNQWFPSIAAVIADRQIQRARKKVK